MRPIPVEEESYGVMYSSSDITMKLKRYIHRADLPKTTTEVDLQFGVKTPTLALVRYNVETRRSLPHPFIDFVGFGLDVESITAYVKDGTELAWWAQFINSDTELATPLTILGYDLVDYIRNPQPTTLTLYLGTEQHVQVMHDKNATFDQLGANKNSPSWLKEKHQSEQLESTLTIDWVSGSFIDQSWLSQRNPYGSTSSLGSLNQLGQGE